MAFKGRRSRYGPRFDLAVELSLKLVQFYPGRVTLQSTDELRTVLAVDPPRNMVLALQDLQHTHDIGKVGFTI